MELQMHKYMEVSNFFSTTIPMVFISLGGSILFLSILACCCTVKGKVPLLYIVSLSNFYPSSFLGCRDVFPTDVFQIDILPMDILDTNLTWPNPNQLTQAIHTYVLYAQTSRLAPQDPPLSVPGVGKMTVGKMSWHRLLARETIGMAFNVLIDYFIFLRQSMCYAYHLGEQLHCR